METSEARPVDASDRVILIDVLRGFALFGVFVSNFAMWFSGSVFLPEERSQAFMTSPVDIAAGVLLMVLIMGKFFTIFSFLFGLGFSIQMDRADARGASIAPCRWCLSPWRLWCSWSPARETTPRSIRPRSCR